MRAGRLCHLAQAKVQALGQKDVQQSDLVGAWHARAQVGEGFSKSDARAIADQLEAKGVKLALGASVHDPTDPMGKMFFNILATFAEFESDLIRMRTREGMAIARAKGKLRGKQPKLSEKQQKELGKLHATGDYSISDLAELFAVSRPTVYRTLQRQIT